MAESGRERDLVLAPNEYAFILDETKGNVIAYVGPHKTSLANTDRPVIFDETSRRFKRCILEEAITQFPFAEEGWYIVLENPAKPGDDDHAKSGPNNLPKLISGRKVNIPGPVTFPLWPGQVARVIQGHHLRSNQYLVIQVYNEDEALNNWAKAVMKPQRGSAPASDLPVDAIQGEQAAPVKSEQETPDLTIGKLLVIKGTEVSFYIPPTGVEVVCDEEGNFIREAATLERLEYCILLDEDGNKRFIQGPAVVFPEPTEIFVEKNGSRKFKAIELNEISGIYIKVIAPYREDNGIERKVGEELFITGKDQMIYFPRPEHAIVKYENQEIHYAVAIPAGEARYVLNRLTGEITLQRGPCMFLPDPRREVIVKRVLHPKMVQLMFPGNQEALEYNRRLMEMAQAEKTEFVPVQSAPAGAPLMKMLAGSPARAERKREIALDEGYVGDDFNRSQKFTPSRTITLDTKFEGVVTIEAWTGYAVLVVSKRGDRKVIIGPKTYLLEYDETLESMELSTGTPKTDEHLIKTVYLRVLNNKVSDVVSAETGDMCSVAVRLSYRVNFEGAPEKWFNVENYVKFLTDHLRSMIRNAVKQYGVEEFYANCINIIRDTVLGVTSEGEKRKGRFFEENGMRVYDVEILDVTIGDDAISDMLVRAQHTAVQQTIQIAQEQRKLEITQKVEDIKQKISEAQFETTYKQLALQKQEVEKSLDLTLAKIISEVQTQEKRLEAELNKQAKLTDINSAELLRDKARQDQELDVARLEMEQRIQELGAEVQAVVDKAKAVSPELIAALQAFGDKHLAEKMAESMSPLAILGGKSIAEVFAQLLKGTILANVINNPEE
jgi:major vault protein